MMLYVLYRYIKYDSSVHQIYDSFFTSPASPAGRGSRAWPKVNRQLRTALTRRGRSRRINFRGPRLDPSPAGRRDVVIDRRTDLRYPDTPGKSSRRPAPRPAAPACGPPRTFSRGDGVSENRPAVEDDIHAACLYSAESRSGLIFLTVPTPPRQSGPVSALF